MGSTPKVFTQLCLLAAVVAWSSTALAQGAQTPIYYFGNDASGGVNPWSKIIFDRNNNLYGTTPWGGVGCNGSGCGTVYELTPQSAGTWALTNYYDFTGGTDGSAPIAGVILDSHGNIYGTTTQGGLYGQGALFELTPGVGGSWIFKVLYNLSDQVIGRLGIDNRGDLYGATLNGTIFALIPGLSGWTYKVIAQLLPLPNGVSAGLLVGKDGVLYGTSYSGGIGTCFGQNSGCGFVFQVTRKAGVWRASTIYDFKGAPSDGAGPNGELLSDSQGNLYSTTQAGGSGACSGGCGTLFRLVRSNGVWKEQILHNFAGGTSDGMSPSSEPIFDGAHELIGTAENGGTANCGVIYKWSPSPPNWTIISNFLYSDGCGPYAPMTFDAYGFLYGTTSAGGVFNGGTVFTMSP